MSVNAIIICDRCSAVIAEDHTAKAARAQVVGRGCLLALPGGRDYCWNCSPDTEAQK